MFKVGDKVRQKNGDSFYKGHHIDTVSEWKHIVPIRGGVWLKEADAWIYEKELELVTDGPVRETTIVKKEIVPGNYDLVVVQSNGYVSMSSTKNKERLAKAIKALQIIHDAME